MLVLDVLIIAICCLLLGLWLWYFPYPSPLIRSFLPPRKKWPEQLIRRWIRSGKYSEAYLRYFYRDPERTVPPEPGLVAPADGIFSSGEVQGGIRYLVIALSFWDMHIQRCPSDGVVVSVEDDGDVFTDGEGREFAFLREKHCPVQKRIVFDTPDGRIAVRLITSLAARRLEVWVRPGECVERGQRLGKILLGSTVVLEIPEHWKITESPGQRVRAAETLIALSGARG